jgi:hypothetical protein
MPPNKYITHELQTEITKQIPSATFTCSFELVGGIPRQFEVVVPTQSFSTPTFEDYGLFQQTEVGENTVCSFVASPELINCVEANKAYYNYQLFIKKVVAKMSFNKQSLRSIDRYFTEKKMDKTSNDYYRNYCKNCYAIQLRKCSSTSEALQWLLQQSNTALRSDTPKFLREIEAQVNYGTYLHLMDYINDSPPTGQFNFFTNFIKTHT